MLLLTTLLLSSAKIEYKKWKAGESFSEYLKRNGIGISLLKEISADDRQYLSEIQAEAFIYELRDKDTLLQALIPIGEEMQIHLYQDIDGEKFHFDITPVTYRKFTDTVSFSIEKGLYDDIYKWTKNPRLGYLLKKYYGKSVNFRRLKKGDKVSFIYTQKSRLGKPYGSPKIKASLIRTGGKKRYIFVDKEGIYYDNINKNKAYIIKKKVEIEAGKPFARPLDKMKITSKFTYKRWHPVLKRYRPHLGVDLRGKRGTLIYATHSGKVIYSGWMSGYGKVVKISHARGFVSLYAHQSRLAVKKGQYVKRGQVIGFVGNTGRSTGPHLHFGLYLNRKAIDPMRYIGKKAISRKKTVTRNITKHKVVEIAGARKNRKILQSSITGKPKAFSWSNYVKPYNLINDRSRYEKRNKEL